MSWPSPLEWLGIVGTLATLTSLVLAWGARDTKKILADMEQGRREAHEQSQATLKAMDDSLKQTLGRMETNAEARYRDLKDRLDGEEAP
jgi:type VI protein secretion system component VasK